MIPKVASHILHHTSRAAAAVQAQTTQSLRNALQFQSGQPSASSTLNPWASTPGSSSSGWGSAGNAKQNAGRKFYSHTQSGDGLVNHATNSTSSHGSGASDDLDDGAKRIIVLRRQPAGQVAAPAPAVRGPKRQRSTSHSSALSYKSSVLDAVLTYARHKHTFATAPQAIEPAPPPRTSVRRNSTSSASVASAEEPATQETLATSDSAVAETATIDSDIDSAPRSATPDSAHASTIATEPDSVSDGLNVPKGQFDPVLMQEFKAALTSQNAPRIDALVKQFREHGPLDINFYNMALRAAVVVRQPGQPLGAFIGVYNEMLANSVRPDESTYKILITAFCDRDFEVSRAMEAIRIRQRRRDLIHDLETSNRGMDEQLHAKLAKEQTIHFQSASELFNLIAPRYWKLGSPVYTALLRSCSVHGDVDQAIKIFAHLERHSKKSGIPPSAFYHLLGVYQRRKDIQGAQEVFREFTSAAKEGKVFWARDARDARKAHIRLYNRMLASYMGTGQPDKAIGLLEQMMDQNGGAQFSHQDIPTPNARSFTELLQGFVDNGDLDSALAWHGKLLQQDTAPLEDSEAPIVTPTRPDAIMWEIVLEACAVTGPPALDKFNALWLQYCEVAPKDGIAVRSMDKQMVFFANLRALDTLDASSSRAQALMDFISQRVLPVPCTLPSSFALIGAFPLRDSIFAFSKVLLGAGRTLEAISVARDFVESELGAVKEYEARGLVTSDVIMHHAKSMRQFVQQITEAVIKAAGDSLPLSAATQLGVFRQDVSLAMRHDVTIATLRAYAAEADGARTPLDASQWDTVLQAAVQYHNWNDAPQGFTRSIPEPDIKRILADLRAQNIDPRQLTSRKRFVSMMVERLGVEETDRAVQEVFSDEAAGKVLSNLVSRSASIAALQANENGPVIEATPASEQLVIDQYHSRIVDEYYPSHPTLTPLDGYQRFEQGFASNIYPSPESIARLIGALGRLGHMDKVMTLYNAAQAVLASLEAKDKQWQSLGWYHVEDQMIVAFAHSGDLASAQIHRQRILQYRGVPSADAYGALISTTKDTTDDVAPALALWEESQTLGVRPHIFLYNTIISKLAKARKVDHALALFQKMKAQGIRPSSVTFGAMISACARVGDAISAEHLFTEMASMNNYKPRIPPFNTLMQLYTYTKPDRSRVLWYYEQMVSAGIAPNGHTYKLLMDAYGMIEPVDFAALENIFESLCQDRKVTVAGSHWASLINAYGCTAKDLDRAISVFEGVATHPSSLRSARAMPDAVVYEALINVLVTARRMDLVPQYIARLQGSGIHMTAYIANLLIKGHAATGNIQTARDLFESLGDPPEGVAAPNNHIPHGAENVSAAAPDAPVYREPSTWEAMVRAELGYGDPTRVDKLLQRMEARRYPSGVINRIRAILLGNDAPELGTPITQLQASLQAQRAQMTPLYTPSFASASPITPPPA